MRALSVGCLLALGSGLGPGAAAQTPQEPTLVLSGYLGVVTGHALWNVDRQPVCQLTGGGGGTFTCSGQYDTVAVSRSVGSGIAGGLSITYFTRRALGFQFDVAYLGLPLDDECTPVSVSSATNQQLCSSVSTSSPGSAFSFDLAVILRRPPGASNLSPFLRAGVGVLTYSESTVEVLGSFDQGGVTYNRAIIADASPRQTSPSATLGAGVIYSLGPGYVFRLEGRDVYASFARAIGPADALGVAPIGIRYYHHMLLSMGLGVVLEQKRGRRY